MNLRSTLLLFVSLLLIAGAAMAAPASAPAPSPAPVVAAAPAPAPGLCIRNYTKANLPDLNPVSQNKSTPTCGSCSVPTCRGVAYNSE